MKPLIITLLWITLCLGNLYAQTPSSVENETNAGGILKGMVYWVDSDTVPAECASIVERSENGKAINGITTDAKGRFTLPIKNLHDTIEVYTLGTYIIRTVITEEMLKEPQKFYLSTNWDAIGCWDPPVVSRGRHPQ